MPQLRPRHRHPHWHRRRHVMAATAAAVPTLLLLMATLSVSPVTMGATVAAGGKHGDDTCDASSGGKCEGGRKKPEGVLARRIYILVMSTEDSADGEHGATLKEESDGAWRGCGLEGIPLPAYNKSIVCPSLRAAILAANRIDPRDREMVVIFLRSGRMKLQRPLPLIRRSMSIVGSPEYMEPTITLNQITSEDQAPASDADVGVKEAASHQQEGIRNNSGDYYNASKDSESTYDAVEDAYGMYACR